MGPIAAELIGRLALRRVILIRLRSSLIQRWLCAVFGVVLIWSARFSIPTAEAEAPADFDGATNVCCQKKAAALSSFPGCAKFSEKNHEHRAGEVELCKSQPSTLCAHSSR